METGERLLSREQSRSDSGAMPSSSTAAAAAAVPPGPSAALAALGEIHEAQEARAASGEADAGQVWGSNQGRRFAKEAQQPHKHVHSCLHHSAIFSVVAVWSHW